MDINKFLFEELLPSKNFTNEVNKIPTEEDLIKEEVTKPSLPPLLEIPAEKKITEEELVLAKNRSFTEGYDKAILEYEHKKSSYDEQITEILEKINIQLMVASSDQNKLLETIKSEAAIISTKICSKINDEISIDTSAIIVRMVDKYIDLISDELSVNIMLHPQTKLLIGDRIQDILVKSRVEHKFFINQSDVIEQSDCLIEWGSGTIEFNKNKLLEKIISKL